MGVLRRVWIGVNAVSSVMAAQLFLQRHPFLAQVPCRFDVVEGAGRPLQLHWIRDAFRLDDC